MGGRRLWLGQENDYDAVVLDGMLPALDGFEVVRQWRAGQRWAPVLMLTARTGFDARIEGLDAGADDYLAKPFISENSAPGFARWSDAGPASAPRLCGLGT